MQCAAYLFLERNYKNDAHTISDMISYYKDMGRYYQVFFCFFFCVLFVCDEILRFNASQSLLHKSGFTSA